MIRGLYTGAAGMLAQQHRMDVISNNLSNVDLNGYKRDISVHKSFPELLIRRMNDDGIHNFPLGSVDSSPIVGKLGTGVEQNEVVTNFTQATLKETNNPFDLAIEGRGFLVVQTTTGERFTRNGSFLLNKEGFLVTKQGDLVLGENGPIQIKENNFVIDQQGRIYTNPNLNQDREQLVSLRENDWNETELIDQLRVVNFREINHLAKQGNSLWKETFESGAPESVFSNSNKNIEAKIRQGFVEGSNVNPVREMVEMIEVQRAYETNSKLIQTQDDLLGKLINESRS